MPMKMSMKIFTVVVTLTSPVSEIQQGSGPVDERLSPAAHPAPSVHRQPIHAAATIGSWRGSRRDKRQINS
jgi:hypothetical protein